MVHDQLKVDITNQVEVMVEFNDSKYEMSQHVANSVNVSDSSLSSIGSARVQVNLLVDPVLHGWTRALRIINYLLTIPKKVKHRAHLIPDENCQICETIETKWEVRTNESNAEKYLFRYETQVIKRCIKSENILEFEEIDCVSLLSGKNSSGESAEDAGLGWMQVSRFHGNWSTSSCCSRRLSSSVLLYNVDT